MTILDEIFAYKRVEVGARRAIKTLAQIRREAESMTPALDFTAALRRAARKPALIAEVKCASPSRGLLIKDFDPLRLATVYRENGAAAISVLTDERYFKGDIGYLSLIAQDFTRRNMRLPLLRKDFILDPYQVYEARAAGADAILLIAAYLEPSCLKELHELCSRLGMAALVEIHNQEELEVVLPLAPALVGINNRNLHDFSVRLETTFELRPYVPDNVCLVAESGIHTAQDVASLADAGVNAVLVGEALVTASDVAAKVRSLVG